LKDTEHNREFSEKVISKIPDLPTNPGVYLYKNSAGKIIYVGKAKNLRNRVRSYFQKGKPADAKTKAMIYNIDDMDFIVTDSEAEALILEDNLIKKNKPRYNILLKDDKTYPYIRVTKELFPRIFSTRKIIRDGSKYIGPFTDAGQMKQLLKTVRTVFKIRSCNLNLTEESIANNKHKLCLDYHIKKCEGPCEALQSAADYNEKVRQAIEVINGKTKELEIILEEQMNHMAEELRFEEAAEIRNKLTYLKEYTSRQKIVSTELLDRDIFGIAKIDEGACSLVFKIRDGKLIGKRHFIIPKALDNTIENILRTTVEKWYLESDFIPKEIVLPVMPDDMDFIADWLEKKRGKSIEFTVPKLGEKKKLVNMANANAEFALRDYFIVMAKKEQSIPRTLVSMQRDLRLKSPPLRIECFDNSHIQGSELVSSMVVFENGRPNKNEYRKYKIRTVIGNDDFASMREVVTRRYTRAIEEKSKLPDLIIIDGGKGQLSAAVGVLEELKILNKVTIVGLAKRLEEIFYPGDPEPVLLPKSSSSLKLIQQVRDEAHRFAITYHRKLREKRTLATELTEIPGLGEKTATKLLVKFGSVENIRKLTLEELEKAVNKSVAVKLREHFEGSE
jgi:excinuclease ABC subunit C